RRRDRGRNDRHAHAGRAYGESLRRRHDRRPRGGGKEERLSEGSAPPGRRVRGRFGSRSWWRHGSARITATEGDGRPDDDRWSWHAQAETGKNGRRRRRLVDFAPPPAAGTGGDAV